MVVLKSKMLKLTPEAILTLEARAREAARRKALGSLTLNQKIKLKDETRKLHLVDRTGKSRGLISIRCANLDCKLKHPDSPAALVWWKLQLEKGKLRCPKCGNNNLFALRK